MQLIFFVEIHMYIFPLESYYFIDYRFTTIYSLKNLFLWVSIEQLKKAV